MKAFIWNTEYDYFVAVAETKKEAIKLLLKKYPDRTEWNGFDEREYNTVKYYNSLSDLLSKADPLILSPGECMEVDHSNE